LNPNHNGLFAQLTAADQASIQKLIQRTELSSSQVLGGTGSPDTNVYFLTSASVALVVRHTAKPGLAVGLVGNEGAVGVQLALGLGPGIFTFLVQAPGTAWFIEGTALRDLAMRRPQLLLSLSRYVWSLAQEVAWYAAFAQSSDVKPRLARWILTSYRHSKQKELTLTQLHLSQMLGVRRSSITLAALELKAEGLVEYRRGKLVVHDPKGLAEIANAGLP
jgi:CRP-like cAMP-binding protein